MSEAGEEGEKKSGTVPWGLKKLAPGAAKVASRPNTETAGDRETAVRDEYLRLLSTSILSSRVYQPELARRQWFDGHCFGRTRRLVRALHMQCFMRCSAHLRYRPIFQLSLSGHERCMVDLGRQTITGDKLHSFSLGYRKKTPFQRQKEAQEEKKKQAELEAAQVRVI